MVVTVDVCVLGPVEVRGAAAPFRRSAAARARGLPVAPSWACAPRGVGARTVARPLGVDVDALLHGVGCPSGTRARRRRSGALYRGMGATWRSALMSARTWPGSKRSPLTVGWPAWSTPWASCGGPVFAGLRCTDWALFDGTEASIQSLVAETALRAADLLLGRGHSAAAERIVRRALLASPYDERLYRSLLRVAAGPGQPRRSALDGGAARRPRR